VIHYADGTLVHLPITNQVNIADRYQFGLAEETAPPTPKPPLIVGWKGNCAFTRKDGRSYLWLYLYTWENPRPELPVTSVDFVSNAVDAAPCLFGITRE